MCHAVAGRHLWIEDAELLSIVLSTALGCAELLGARALAKKNSRTCTRTNHASNHGQHPHDRLGNYRRQVYSFVQHSSCILREAYMTHCFKRHTFTRAAHALCVCSTHIVEERLCWHPCGADHSSAWCRFVQRNPIFINVKASRLGSAL